MAHSSSRNLNNVKIFVLYLMKNINYPMDFSTVNDIVMQNDYIMYLDFEEAFHQMLGQELICENGKDEHGNALYEVTRKGAMVAEELKSDILPSILDQSLSCALRYLDFRARGVTVETDSQRRADNSFDVTLTLKEKGKLLFSTTVNVDSAIRSQQIRESFRDRPDVIYRATLALLAGKVNYLFDK